jgi:hypothetical protein
MVTEAQKQHKNSSWTNLTSALSQQSRGDQSQDNSQERYQHRTNHNVAIELARLDRLNQGLDSMMKQT